MSFSEVHSTVCCIHPYFGYVCTPHATLDFSEKLPPVFMHGAKAKINSRGFRGDEWPEEKPKGEIWIGLFGGSVAFSVSSTDETATIAYNLQQRLNVILSEQKKATRVRVLNLALPGGQQPQHLFIYLQHRHLLDGIITFDGINEVIVPTIYNFGFLPHNFPYKPYYEVLFGHQINETHYALMLLQDLLEKKYRSATTVMRAIGKGLYNHLKRIIQDRQRAESSKRGEFHSIFYKTGTAEKQLEIGKIGAENWASSIRAMDYVRAGERKDALYVLQPVPEIGKRLTGLEKSIIEDYQEEVVALRRQLRPLLEEKLDILKNKLLPCEDFKDVFISEDGDIYNDHIHFEDRGCVIVAEKLAQILMERWKCLDMDYQSG
jgi:hypothetical protein